MSSMSMARSVSASGPQQGQQQSLALRRGGPDLRTRFADLRVQTRETVRTAAMRAGSYIARVAPAERRRVEAVNAILAPLKGVRLSSPTAQREMRSAIMDASRRGMPLKERDLAQLPTQTRLAVKGEIANLTRFSVQHERKIVQAGRDPYAIRRLSRSVDPSALRRDVADVSRTASTWLQAERRGPAKVAQASSALLAQQVRYVAAAHGEHGLTSLRRSFASLRDPATGQRDPGLTTKLDGMIAGARRHLGERQPQVQRGPEALMALAHRQAALKTGAEMAQRVEAAARQMSGRMRQIRAAVGQKLPPKTLVDELRADRMARQASPASAARIAQEMGDAVRQRFEGKTVAPGPKMQPTAEVARHAERVRDSLTKTPSALWDLRVGQPGYKDRVAVYGAAIEGMLADGRSRSPSQPVLSVSPKDGRALLVVPGGHPLLRDPLFASRAQAGLREQTAVQRPDGMLLMQFDHLAVHRAAMLRAGDRLPPLPPTDGPGRSPAFATPQAEGAPRPPSAPEVAPQASLQARQVAPGAPLEVPRAPEAPKAAAPAQEAPRVVQTPAAEASRPGLAPRPDLPPSAAEQRARIYGVINAQMTDETRSVSAVATLLKQAEGLKKGEAHDAIMRMGAPGTNHGRCLTAAFANGDLVLVEDNLGRFRLHQSTPQGPQPVRSVQDLAPYFNADHTTRMDAPAPSAQRRSDAPAAGEVLQAAMRVSQLRPQEPTRSGPEQEIGRDVKPQVGLEMSLKQTEAQATLVGEYVQARDARRTPGAPAREKPAAVLFAEFKDAKARAGLDAARITDVELDALRKAYAGIKKHAETGDREMFARIAREEAERLVEQQQAQAAEGDRGYGPRP